MCQGLDSLCWGWSSYLYPCNCVKTHHMILDPCVNDHLLTQGNNVSWSTPAQMDQLNIFLTNNKLKLPPNFSWDGSGPAQTCYCTWKINMEHNDGGVVQIIFLCKWVIFRCHVNFQECKLWGLLHLSQVTSAIAKDHPFDPLLRCCRSPLPAWFFWLEWLQFDGKNLSNMVFNIFSISRLSITWSSSFVQVDIGLDGHRIKPSPTFVCNQNWPNTQKNILA